MYFRDHLHWKPWFVLASDDTLKDDISELIWNLGFLAAAHTWSNCTSAVLIPFSYLAHINSEPKDHTTIHRQIFLKSLFTTSRKDQKSSCVLCSRAPPWEALSLSTSSTALPFQIGCSSHLGSTLHVWQHIKNCFPTNRTKRGHISLVLHR